MKLKNIIAFILFLALIFSLAGCDGDTVSNTTEPPSITTPAATSPSNTETPDEIPSDNAMYPVADETVNLTAWGAIQPAMISNIKDGDINNIGNIKLAGQATNIHVDWTTASMDNGFTLLGVLLLSDDIPDILTCMERFYQGGRSELIAEGICVDLVEYAPEWAPDWYEIYKSNDVYTSAVSTSDGKVAQMYSLKNYIDQGPAIRKDWLDRLNMDVPETYDELTDALLGFVNEIGIDTGVALAGDFAWGANAEGWLSGGYGVSADIRENGRLPWQVDENGKVHMSLTLEGAYEFYSMIREWYKAGIINSDIFSTAPVDNDQRLLGGEVGLYMTSVSHLSNTAADTSGDPDFKLVAMADVTQKEGATIKMGGLIDGITNFGASVYAESDNIEYAMKYLNWFWTEEGIAASNFGVEGVTYHYDGNGNMYWDELISNNPNGLPLKMAQYVHCGYVGFGYLMSYDVMSMSFDNDTQREAQGIWTSNRSNDYVYYGSMTVEEEQIYNLNLVDMATYIKEILGKYISGAEPLENYWINIDKLYEMGLQDMIDVKQAAYDRFISG